VTGLASHFRDLLVSKDAVTVDLLEVGPNVKQRYLDQANSCSLHFLVPALGILNTCDVRYKTASNQRLLVEVSLMELVKLLEKKNPEPTSQPEVSKAQNKKAITQQPKPSQKITVEKGAIAERTQEKPENIGPIKQDESESKSPAQTDTNPINKDEPPRVVEEPVTSIPSPAKPEPKPESSDESKADKPAWMKALSGKSGVRIKPTEQLKQETDKATDEEPFEPTGPVEVFSEKDFDDAWKEFLKKIANRKSIFALLSSRKPQLKNLHEIHFELENKTQVSYIQNIQHEMLTFLREKLRNYKLSVFTHIHEQHTEKRPYTAEERYMAMIKKNPNLDALRKALDMDIE
jgi:DNA polymerase-3 subunit gamma/tau